MATSDKRLGLGEAELFQQHNLYADVASQALAEFFKHATVSDVTECIKNTKSNWTPEAIDELIHALRDLRMLHPRSKPDAPYDT
jgi:hypothetical protein